MRCIPVALITTFLLQIGNGRCTGRSLKDYDSVSRRERPNARIRPSDSTPFRANGLVP